MSRRPRSMRTHLCGELRPEHIGRPSPCAAGSPAAASTASTSPSSTCATTPASSSASSTTPSTCAASTSCGSPARRARPEGTVNPNLPTGEVEIGDCTVEVLRAAEPPPFPIDARADDVDENVRLQYRYLDLRRERMQRNLRIRAAVNSAIRTAMEAQGFVEVETPMLVPSTPEGAREFLVPSRKEPGSFYALPQSPQLFKQLLMVAGIDRYYQIARCLRDEDLRADRQYEFMQLDAEMSFVDQDDVLAAISEAVLAPPRRPPGSARRRSSGSRGTRRWTASASTSPTCASAWSSSSSPTSSPRPSSRRSPAAAAIKGINVPGGGGVRPQPARQAHRPGQGARRQGARVAEGRADGTLRLAGRQVPLRGRGRGDHGAPRRPAGDLVLIVADEWATTCEVLGQLRNDLGRPPVHEGPYRYVWVVDFPMFVGVDAETGRPKPAHHPFTQPHPDDVDLLETDPMAVQRRPTTSCSTAGSSGRARSGSTSRPAAPGLRRLGITDEEADRKFGFFLNPFEYGAPPHGGFAFGIDRLVAILAGEENIREVIAFPKTQSGSVRRSSSPSSSSPSSAARSSSCRGPCRRSSPASSPSTTCRSRCSGRCSCSAGRSCSSSCTAGRSASCATRPSHRASAPIGWSA